MQGKRRSARTPVVSPAQPAGRDYVDWLDSVGELETVPQRRAQLSVGIILWPEFPLLSLTGIVEALRHAGDIGDESRKVLCDWTVMAATRTPVRSSCGIDVVPDAAFEDPRRFDCIFVIGGLLRSMALGEPQVLRYLWQTKKAQKLVVGVCTGTMILAEAGLVRTKACVHPYHVEDFQARFPTIKVVSNEDYLWTDEGATVPGGTSIISFMSYLIARYCGSDRASKTVHQMTLPSQRGSAETDRKRALGYQHAEDSRLKRAVLLMEGAMRKPRSLESIAAAVGVSGRQLERLFQTGFGVSPKRFMLDLRLRYARWLLLNTPLSVTEIAYQTGFADCSHLVRSFRKWFGNAPGACRRGVGGPATVSS